MGLDVKFGWHHFWLELHDTEFSTSVSIEEEDDEYGWLERDSPDDIFFIESEESEKLEEKYKKWETNPNVRFGPPSRILSATAKFREYYGGEFRVGIPEDKESWGFEDSKVINSIDLIIREGYSEAEWKSMKWRGVLGHIKSDEEIDIEESTYLDLRVNSAFFDTIEKTINQGATKLGIAVQIKCWHWVDPLGHSTLFIDEEENGRAEISRFSGTKSNQDESVEHVFDDPNYDGESIDSSNIDVHSFNKLSIIETQLKGIKILLIAIAVFLAIASYRFFN